MAAETSTKPTKVQDEEEPFDMGGHHPFEKNKKLSQNLVNMSLVSNTSTSDEYMNERPGKSPLYYLTNQKELRDEHPVWHYFYLCALVLVAFVALFIGPVIFGMLAAIGGIGTPFILSMIGSGVGLLLGLAFGVIFAVVCIVALVRAVGIAADWVLNTLWFGGNDLLDMTKEKVLTLITDSP